MSDCEEYFLYCSNRVIKKDIVRSLIYQYLILMTLFQSGEYEELRKLYEPSENFIEVRVSNPQSHGLGKDQYIDYEVSVRV